MWNFDKVQEQEKERRLFHLRLALLIIMVAALLLAGGGCNLAAKLQALEGQPVDQGVPDLATGNLSNPPPQEQKTKVTVYFEDQQGRYLVPTVIDVDKAPGIAKEAVDALCLGPAQGAGTIASIPVGVQARSVNIKANGTCVVDLGGSVSQDKLTPKEEALAVYALVNTLTEFRNVKRVQILVDGREQATLTGHIPIDEPLLRNLTFVNNQD